MARCTIGEDLGLSVVPSTSTLAHSYHQLTSQTLSLPTTNGLEISSTLNPRHAGILSGGWSGYLMGVESIREAGDERDVFIAKPSSTQLSSAPMKCRVDATFRVGAASPHMQYQSFAHGYTHEAITTTPSILSSSRRTTRSGQPTPGNPRLAITMEQSDLQNGLEATLKEVHQWTHEGKKRRKGIVSVVSAFTIRSTLE
ncbi:hypothetical protein PQX77_019456 [Marasmius sp. AFHP31]|nr:hypothetical protein PQX77_019456 [Marasmius sp. AFHP31]